MTTETEARELLAAEYRVDGNEPPSSLAALPLEEMSTALGVLWPRSLRAITAALAQRDEAREQALELRDTLKTIVRAGRLGCDAFDFLAAERAIAKWEKSDV
jgi:hypothetical protein